MLLRSMNHSAARLDDTRRTPVLPAAGPAPESTPAPRRPARLRDSQNLRTLLIVQVVFLALIVLLALAGCGTGGYAGTGVSGLSASAITIDAGQSYPITSKSGAGTTVSWTLSGGSGGCTGAACGSISATQGLSTIYTAPAGLTTPMKLTVTGTIAGTTSTETVAITVNPDPTITGTPPAGTVGTPYSTTLIAAGGTGTLKWTIANDTLPSGLNFNTSTGTISGTPTSAGSSTVVVQITDQSDVPDTVSASETIVISAVGAPLTVLSGNPPNGVVGTPYMTVLLASGGTAPDTWSVLAGSLPAGLTISPTTGVISGTPTAQGTSTFTAQATDANGTKATGVFSITITTAATPLTLTLSTLPSGIVGTPYSATIGVTGGTAPYTCAITGGTLQAGLSLGAGCVVSGTPTASGTVTLIVKATDSSSPAANTSGPITLTIAPLGTSLTVGSLPNGVVGTPYSATLAVTGGTAPYTCALSSGSLPAGLTLGANCLVSGTPTTVGTASANIKATDSSSPALTVTGAEPITISASVPTLTTGTLPAGVVGTPYSATIGVTGGTAPYSCVFTSGTLPAGLTLGANCLVSGTPTAAGTASLVVKAVDSSSPTQTVSGPESITITASAPTLVITSPPAGVVGTPYSGTIPVTGGKAPYTCALTAGTLPAGITLGTNCAVTGTATTAGSTTIAVKATDSSSPSGISTGPVTLTFTATAPTLTTGTLPNGVVNTPYTATIGVTGGTAPYTCALSSGTLPAGLTLATNCVVSGTPTTAGTSVPVVKVTDSSSPAQTVTGPESITITAAVPTLTVSSPPAGVVGTPYTGTIPVTGGTAPYSCSITAGTLPAGITLGANSHPDRHGDHRWFHHRDCLRNRLRYARRHRLWPSHPHLRSHRSHPDDGHPAQRPGSRPVYGHDRRHRRHRAVHLRSRLRHAARRPDAGRQLRRQRHPDHRRHVHPDDQGH